MALVHLAFGQPKHGWVEVHLSIGGKSIEFVASDVPNNPMQQLVDALALSSRGLEATVWWHLEPDGYYFKFSPLQSQVQLECTFAAASKNSSESEVASVVGSREGVLLPIWRALRFFQSLCHDARDWPPVSFEGLENSREVLR
ncbi:hypothetical protein ACIGHN_27090 [Acidovorax sp. NPDC077693]|uniref:hypothetical protein n=1 Tax=unclassified Acidovorax TaxID=2684926 RepID=UPI0037C71646